MIWSCGNVNAQSDATPRQTASRRRTLASRPACRRSRPRHRSRTVRRLLQTEAGDAAAAARRRGIPVETVERRLLDRRFGTGAVHQGIALQCDPLPPPDLEALAAPPGPARLLLLDRVSDPRNVGAVLRSAEAFGARAVILPAAGAPAESAALAKAAAGALERVPLARVVNLARMLERLKAAGYWFVALDGTGRSCPRPPRPRRQGGARPGSRGRGHPPPRPPRLRLRGRHPHERRRGQPQRGRCGRHCPLRGASADLHGRRSGRGFLNPLQEGQERGRDDTGQPKPKRVTPCLCVLATMPRTSPRQPPTAKSPSTTISATAGASSSPIPPTSPRSARPNSPPPRASRAISRSGIAALSAFPSIRWAATGNGPATSRRPRARRSTSRSSPTMTATCPRSTT